MTAQGRAGAAAPVSAARCRGFRLVLPLLLCGLAACSGRDDPDAWYNKTLAENFARQPAPQPGYAPHRSRGLTAAVAAVPEATSMPESELYRSEASCGGVALGGAGTPAYAADTISIEMTECEVVHRAGPPDMIELSVDERGARFLLMTYPRGERPRRYRFAAGRLVAIEALPAPPPARDPRPRRR